ncbi:hypothetical protein ACP70R_011505 [Stipagrostis hirtigluma subsp. patula]
MKQKTVIKVSMPCEKCRTKAMALAARADGVISIEITGDDRLVVVGDGLDPVRLVSCLRRKLGHAVILQVDEVKDKKPEEEEKDKKPEGPTAQPEPVPAPPPQWDPGYCYWCHHRPPAIVFCDEPSNCSIM